MDPRRSNIVATLQAWVGIKEGSDGHKKILDIYNNQKPLPQGYKMKSTDSWCACTVTAAYIAAGCQELCPCECSCSRMVTKAKSMGIWQESDSYVPSPGDLILYYWNDSGVGDCTANPNHVGMIEYINGSTMSVIEGNKNDAVERRSIQVNGRYIRGFVTPKFNDTQSEVVKPVSNYGIDTSKHQSSGVDYIAAASYGYSFAILRIGCNGSKDTTFDKDFANAKKSNLKLGVYYAVNQNILIDTAKAVEFATQAVKWLNGAHLDLPIFFDIEGSVYNKTSRKTANSQLYNMFASIIKDNGYVPGLYTGMSMFNTSFNKDLITSDTPLWIARYNTTPPDIGRPVHIWQYSSAAQPTDFYSLELDRNLLLVYISDMMQQTTTTVVPAPQPQTQSTSSILKQPQYCNPSAAGVYYTTGSLYLRYGPDKTYKSITVMPINSQVIANGQYSVDANGIAWMIVSYKNKTGFCSCKYLRK